MSQASDQLPDEVGMQMPLKGPPFYASGEDANQLQASDQQQQSELLSSHHSHHLSHHEGVPIILVPHEHQGHHWKKKFKLGPLAILIATLPVIIFPLLGNLNNLLQPQIIPINANVFAGRRKRDVDELFQFDTPADNATFSSRRNGLNSPIQEFQVGTSDAEFGHHFSFPNPAFAFPKTAL